MRLDLLLGMTLNVSQPSMSLWDFRETFFDTKLYKKVFFNKIVLHFS